MLLVPIFQNIQAPHSVEELTSSLALFRPFQATKTIANPFVIEAKLESGSTVGVNRLRVVVKDSGGTPIAGAKITLSVGMTEMDMGTAHPSVVDLGSGNYSANLEFSMEGNWRVGVKVELPNGSVGAKSFDFKPGQSMDGEAHHHHDGGSMDHMEGMSMGSMLGHYGPWSMQREGSGTSWLPDSSPMFMKPLPSSGRYDLNAMGFINFDENQAGGYRGHSRFFSNSMFMLMARRETGGGILGLNVMGSLDVLFNGEYGYPDLFQTGETAHGIKLTDYQHPHDLIDEVTVSYSHPLREGLRAFLYGGPVGEPALGGPTFMHRPSGMEIPEAPITHHYFDSTHISWGVATFGLNTQTMQWEGSVFNGHEPNENRYLPDALQLNSGSTRFTYNPTRNLSFNASYGYLNSPESPAPGVDQHRLTAAGLWSQPLGHGDNLSVTLAFGRNYIANVHRNGFLSEATYLHKDTSYFVRWEHVEKDELIGVPSGNYMINKFLFGAVQNFAKREGLELGVGAYAGLYVFPNSLNPYYGHNPVTLGVFLRLRPQRMNHEMGHGMHHEMHHEMPGMEMDNH
jgi:hypothetical protein